MTIDETQIQIFADWPILHAKRVTKDNRKNPLSPCIRPTRLKFELTDQDSAGGWGEIHYPGVTCMLVKVGDLLLSETALIFTKKDYLTPKDLSDRKE